MQLSLIKQCKRMLKVEEKACLQANSRLQWRNQAVKCAYDQKGVHSENQHMNVRDGGGQKWRWKCCPVCQLTALLLPSLRSMTINL